jgi:murein DD-endopeptidase MepM/ murein hydrolase activator NlpD
MIDTKLSTGGAPESAAPSHQSQSGAREQALALAREFESMLMLQMIRQMRQSLLDEDEKVDGLGNETMTDTIDGELARSLSASGGLGFSKWFAESLDARGDRASGLTGFAAGVGGLSSNVVPPSTALAEAEGAGRAGSRPVAAPTMSPIVAPAPIDGLPVTPVGDVGLEPGEEGLRLDGAVTSSFGLRADPFHGRTRMHSGVDIRAAYGRSVPSAADGEVTFAGERGGYGQLVVVRHADGVETRYAHLSSIDVKVGQRVQSGEMVGRIGQTGRATGPHLHFEVLEGGRHLDPLRWAQHMGRLKPAEPVVDLPFDWSPRPVAVNGVQHEN